jgi:hypothetical protein
VSSRLHKDWIKVPQRASKTGKKWGKQGGRRRKNVVEAFS